MTADQFIKIIKELIALDKIDEAINIMRTFLENSPFLNEILLQSARFNNVLSQIRVGTISHADATLTQNQIRYGLMLLLNEIEKQATAKPKIKTEVDSAISITNSKNVILNSSVSGQNIHIGDIIYNYAKSEENLSYDFNKSLTRQLVLAIKPYNEKAEKLSQDFSWLDHAENRRKVQKFLFQNFVGEIGKQLRKLINIGDDEKLNPAEKKSLYVNKCLDIAKRTLELVNYTLLSVLWDNAKQQNIKIDNINKQALENLFESGLELKLSQQVGLLELLITIFDDNQLNLPLNELHDLKPKLGKDSVLMQSAEAIEDTNLTKDYALAEESLAQMLAHFGFLTNYKMASIKKISYRQIRNGRPEYLHRYVALGLDIKFSGEDAEKGKWITFGEQTPAILLYQGEDYQKGINLFPFVIDYNALTFEQGAKICFFSTQNMNGDSLLDYRFLGDNSIVSIEKKGICKPDTNLSELMMDTEKLKAFNLDCVIDGFLDAKKAILKNDNDFFDNL